LPANAAMELPIRTIVMSATRIERFIELPLLPPRWKSIWVESSACASPSEVLHVFVENNH
jgi:hypothetical protein